MGGKSVRFEEVPLDVIERPTVELRGHVNEAGMEELRASIKRRGVLVPIIVAETETGYRLVAGLRRLVCCAANGLATIPAIIVASDEGWEAWATVAENSIREGVNPVDEATYIAALLERRSLSNAEAAQLLDKSESWVSQRLGILRWPEDVREAVRQGWLSFSAGREIAGIEDELARRYCLRTAHRLGCSTRQAMTWRKNWEAENRLSRGSVDEATNVPAGDLSSSEMLCVFCRELGPVEDGVVGFTCSNCLSQIESLLNREEPPQT